MAKLLLLVLFARFLPLPLNENSFVDFFVSIYLNILLCFLTFHQKNIASKHPTEYVHLELVISQKPNWCMKYSSPEIWHLVWRMYIPLGYTILPCLDWFLCIIIIHLISRNLSRIMVTTLQYVGVIIRIPYVIYEVFRFLFSK